MYSDTIKLFKLKRAVSQNNNVVLIEIPYHAEDIKDFLICSQLSALL